MTLRPTCFACLLTLATCTTLADNRDIQIVNVMLDDAVVHLFNFGDIGVDLDGWRFCTQSTVEVRRYTSSTGLNGESILPNESLFIHLNNDAPALANHLNVSSLGGIFAGLDLEAFAISFYFPSPGGFIDFGDSTLMADHIQFSRNGLNNFTADERSDEAVDAGLWTAVNDWISIATDSQTIELADSTGGLLHGPSDYNVLGPECIADMTGNGSLDIFDVFAFLDAFNAGDLLADFDGNGVLTIFDFFTFLDEFNAGCP